MNMPDDLQTKIYVACWGAAAGGIVSLVLNVLQPRIKRWNLTRQIKAYPEEVHGSHKRCRVCNGGYWTISQAMLYIALEWAACAQCRILGDDCLGQGDEIVRIGGDVHAECLFCHNFMVFSVTGPEVPKKLELP
jgi:hypothetical protein